MNLVLFDFDGTITRDDSLLEFVAYVVGFKKFFRGILVLSPILAAYKLGLASNNFTRRKLLGYFFAGMSADKFDKICKKYSTTHIEDILKQSAMDKIASYKAAGDRVVIVTASLEDWLRPWCEAQGLELLGTKIRRKGGIITGEIEGQNCYGAQKVARVRAAYDVQAFDRVIAYGDSRGDREMLEFADEAHYKAFE
ncbi:HAD-IB family hydrolase [Campylobacter gracilis]|uniref:HAD hydrolase, family IB n=1 Tax=Campylobacter gracilis RM3268 TaxID=553220 RepID=C8PKR3_9BACT|nr:HAD-IB family hydrolase [Campylobacter gracilis]AKT91487.1 HAD-superfamily hydrolase, subfamily IB [Campylobacter gracilis]EEV16672.1 HAD hydrolase, family IB [Campylobacter gracilis RM3268]UEB46302.1 HAD-IB family hydrolase [Campylobacter gracilis]SUW78075.1 HAD hydrolase, family IB [Campylobacter gracilis]